MLSLFYVCEKWVNDWSINEKSSWISVQKCASVFLGIINQNIVLIAHTCKWIWHHIRAFRVKHLEKYQFVIVGLSAVKLQFTSMSIQTNIFVVTDKKQQWRTFKQSAQFQSGPPRLVLPIMYVTMWEKGSQSLLLVLSYDVK